MNKRHGCRRETEEPQPRDRPGRGQHRTVTVCVCRTAVLGAICPICPAHTDTSDDSTPHTPLCLMLYELITSPRACLHRKCLITISFISSAAFITGKAVLGGFLYPALADSSLLLFFTWGSLAEISAHSRKRRLARCVVLACSSNDLG